MWYLVDNPDSIALIESFYTSGKPIAAVCHSPAVFHRRNVSGRAARQRQACNRLYQRRRSRCQLTHVVPFLVEDELKRIGALYDKAADWAPFALVDGGEVTGRNPASSTIAVRH
jgi:putative intracellular protease/amidase